MRTKENSGAPSLSIDEIVSAIKHSRLITILVEGKSDLEVYRWLESYLSDQNVDVLQCGGRSRLFDIFERRNEFSKNNVIFIADRDMWLFTSIPEKYQKEIFFTQGYSLENDVYSIGIMAKLLEADEAKSFQQVIGELSKWFAFEIEGYLKDPSRERAFPHANQICPSDRLCPTFSAKIGYREAQATIVEDIKKHYAIKLRGKTLFEVALRFLSKTSRKSKYSYKNLLEMFVKLDTPPIVSFCSTIKQKITANSSPDTVQTELVLKAS